MESPVSGKMLTPEGAAVLIKDMPDLKSITSIEHILFESINVQDI
jgi:hypothetical protein